MKTLRDVQAGDTVLLLEDRRPPREVTVAKVGRKLIHIETWGTSLQFRLDDGGNNREIGWSCIVTHDEHAENLRRKEIWQRLLDEFGLRPEFGRHDRISTEKLEKILALLDE